MTRIFASTVFSLLAITACHHDTASRTPASSQQSADADVDPTLPSWAPRSCKAYHANVVRLSGCTAAAEDIRTGVTTRYDADTKAWHDLTNARQEDLDRIAADCAAKNTSVEAQLTASCPTGGAQATR